ncbi:lytic transglycosylase domain-containing protein [Synechococcus sp. BSA11S]|uniref:lytic transglycosylase domain-containing protein n=1 Tax=Synechococcus sp. BSA11S TaxID=2599077 RepID=UPI00162547CA|nr:lytic transglycosylase domain-containing protein [Synechococcus sp. BSA11S]
MTGRREPQNAKAVPARCCLTLPNPSPAGRRGPLTLALTVIGSGALLLLGRLLLQQRPLPTPDTPALDLERIRRWDPDPERRREAGLLLLPASSSEDPSDQRRLLRGQGWGPGPLAAVALKRAALAREAQGLAATLQWRELLERFPMAPPSADALYALGREDPPQRLELLRRFPAHPAALAAALELGPQASQRQQGALHLARWGPRWPGADARLRQICAKPATALSAVQRGTLAAGLARVGDGRRALSCLGSTRGEPPQELEIGRALLRGGPSEARAGAARLLALSRERSQRPEALEAVRLLAQTPAPTVTPAELSELPEPLRLSAPAQARLVLDAGGDWRPVLQRWPRDPASWDLQWDLTRAALLKGEAEQALALLEALPATALPPPLAARHLFWRGMAQRQLGQPSAARRSWDAVLRRLPWSYYAWRSRVQLGEQPELRLRAAGPIALAAEPWQPLNSGQPDLDRLWRLALHLEAWEQWRQERPSATLTSPEELMLEGRLRQGVGDDWTGLGQLEQASLRWTGGDCQAKLPLERALLPIRHGEAFSTAAARHGLDPTLLLAVARQESRFTPGVGSVAGAIGLLQLMPATAAELAGGVVSKDQLREPAFNAELGAAYLNQMLALWKDNPFLAIASYNAGPGAVADWQDGRLQASPELWVEAIPYPETRLYVKKVLGNLWGYQERPRRSC